MGLPLFRAFGTRVKLHWSLLVFVLFLALQAGDLVLGVQWAALLFAAVLIHEFGHVAAARRAGLVAPEIWLTPLGGTAYLVGGYSSWKAEAVVAAAGPATSLTLFAVAAGASYAAYGGLAPWTLLGSFATINGVLVLFNSIPAYPLDGGVVLRVFLASRWGSLPANRAVAVLGQVLAVGFVVAGVFQLRSMWGWILIAIGISNFLSCRRLRAASRGFAPSVGEGIRERLKAAQRRRRRAKQMKVEKRVDELLEKVGREGLPSLSWSERRFLKKASGLYRERKRS